MCCLSFIRLSSSRRHKFQGGIFYAAKQPCKGHQRSSFIQWVMKQDKVVSTFLKV